MAEKSAIKRMWDSFYNSMPGYVAANTARDAAISLGKGIVNAGESAVGLGDLLTGGAIGKGLAHYGYDPQATRQMLDSWYSPAQQEAMRNVSDARGVVDTTMAMAKNPYAAIQAGIEAVPTMVGGTTLGVRAVAPGAVKAVQAGRAARAKVLMKGKPADQVRAMRIQTMGEPSLSPTGLAVAGAAGEGVVGMGQKGAELYGGESVPGDTGAEMRENYLGNIAKAAVQGGAPNFAAGLVGSGMQRFMPRGGDLEHALSPNLVGSEFRGQTVADIARGRQGRIMGGSRPGTAQSLLGGATTEGTAENWMNRMAEQTMDGSMPPPERKGKKRPAIDAAMIGL